MAAPLLFANLTIPPAASVNAAAAGTDARQLAAAGAGQVVPLVYGEDRLGGLILNVLPTTAGGSTVAVQVLWAFACDSINDVRWQDQALPGGVTATHYTGTQATADATMVAAFAAQGITYADTLNGYAYSVFTFAASLFDGQLNFTARIRGRKLYDSRLDSTAGGSGAHRLADPATWTWSDCPALALADYLRSTVYGAGTTVDNSTLAAAANANDALIGSPAEKRRMVGVSFASPADVSSVADALRVYAGCWLLPGVNGIKLLADADGATQATYAHASGQIYSIEPLNLRDLGNTPTVVEVLYTDTSRIPYREGRATAQLSGAGTTLPWRVSQVRLPGIKRHSQAYREAVERLNKLTLMDVSTVIEVFDQGIQHDPGDIITITHPIGLTSKLMRVADVAMTALGRWRLSVVEHDAAAYSTAVVTLTTLADGSRIIGADMAVAWANISGRPTDAEILNSYVRTGGSNLIGNSGFLKSSAGVPTGWNVYNNAGIPVTTECVAGGMFGLNLYRITAGAATTSELGLYTSSQPQSVTTWNPGQTYCISFWARSGAGLYGATVSALQTNMGWTSAEVLEQPALSASFQRYVFRVVPADNGFTGNGQVFFTWSPAGGITTFPAGQNLDITAPKVEMGMQPSAWTPGPFDTLNINLEPSITVAQLAAAAAQAAADAAQSTANTAASNATTALSTLATIRSNGYLDAAEKPSVIREWNAIVAEYPAITAQAGTYSITTQKTAYDAAYGALASYLQSLTPSWSDTTQDTPITPATDQTKWADYYGTRGTLLSKIADEAGKRAQWAQVANVPSNVVNATVDLNLVVHGTGSSGVTVQGNRVAYSVGSWSAGVYSKQSYIGGCSVVFAVEQVCSFMVGINSAGDLTDSGYGSLDYAVYLTAGGAVYYYESGTSGGSFPAYVAGDVFEIRYDGAFVRYYKNGVQFRAVAASGLGRLFLDSSFADAGAVAGLQFKPVGSQAWTDILGDSKPADYATSDLTLLAHGTNASGVTVQGNRIRFNVASWSAGAYSKQSYVGGCSLVFSPEQANQAFMLGINTAGDLGDGSYGSIDYAIYCTNSGTLEYYESGVGAIASGAYAVGDVFELRYDGVYVRYLRNGVEFRAVPAAGLGRLYVDSSFAGDGAVAAIQFRPVGSQAWGDIGGTGKPADNATRDLTLINQGGTVIIRGSSLWKHTSGNTENSWDSGVYSKESYTGGAYLSFVPESNVRKVMVGLNTDPATDATWPGIDWAMYCADNGNVYASESGTLHGPLTAYSGGESMAITYDGANVRYMVNGVVLRTVAAVITAPLFLDSSFANVLARVDQVSFGPMSAVRDISTAQIAAGAATGVYTNTISSYNVTQGTGIQGNAPGPYRRRLEQVVAVTFTATITGSCFVEVYGSLLVTTGATSGSFEYGIREVGAYSDDARVVAVDQAASIGPKRYSANLSLRVAVTAGVSYTMIFGAARFDSSMTVVAEGIELAVQEIKR